MRPRPAAGARWPVLAGAAVATLAVGSLVLRFGSGDQEGSDRSAATGGPSSTGQSRTDNDGGGDVDRSDGRRDPGTTAPGRMADRDEAGAVAAALTYTGAPQRWLYLTDADIADAVREVATPAAADRLTTEAVDQIQAVREQLLETSGRVWWLVQPLAWRVEELGDDEAVVGVWTVTVLAAEGVAVPQATWLTVTSDLRWVDGRWRLEAVWERPGPTPMVGADDRPWEGSEFDDALDGFTRLGREPG